MKESDLYLPVKRFLESQGYQVKGELGNCDVAAVRGDQELVVVELKLSLNLELILQAVERLSVTSKVYVGVPVWNNSLKRRRRQTVKLLRMLGLGLLVIDPEVERHGVDVVLDPGEYRPRRSRRRRELLLGEFVRRVGDPNLGGASVRKGIMTAYRQRTLEIALFLQTNGPNQGLSRRNGYRRPQSQRHPLPRQSTAGSRGLQTVSIRSRLGECRKSRAGLLARSSRGYNLPRIAEEARSLLPLRALVGLG